MMKGVVSIKSLVCRTCGKEACEKTAKDMGEDGMTCSQMTDDDFYVNLTRTTKGGVAVFHFLGSGVLGYCLYFPRQIQYLSICL